MKRCSYGGGLETKLLLDEMFSGLKDYLEVMGWKTITVNEASIRGAEDRVIAEYARENNLLLVTQDRKSAELAEMMGVKVIYISNATIAKIADKEIRDKYPISV